jgi:hypothetical protein
MDMYTPTVLSPPARRSNARESIGKSAAQDSLRDEGQQKMVLGERAANPTNGVKLWLEDSLA